MKQRSIVRLKQGNRNDYFIVLRMEERRGVEIQTIRGEYYGWVHCRYVKEVSPEEITNYVLKLEDELRMIREHHKNYLRVAPTVPEILNE